MIVGPRAFIPWDAANVARLPALTVCKAFIDSQAELKVNGPRAFVYISAEDCGRPLVPAGYVESKREAEAGIEEMTRVPSAVRVYAAEFANLQYFANAFTSV